MMNWSDLLNTYNNGTTQTRKDFRREPYIIDADRISFSAPFRRLANKTQVHPLHDHDHIHHRLIHSVETASVGRSLGIGVGQWLEDENHIDKYERHTIAGIIQAACLAHDIGNPPFGHSGESAIGAWFAQQFDTPNPLFTEIDDNLRPEFMEFEGNAQGFRILTRLEMYRNEGGMRLSHGVLGAFSKYPVTADVQRIIEDHTKEIHGSDFKKHLYCGLKKFGVFHSEAEQFHSYAKILGLPQENHDGHQFYRRHPLVFLVEAADDICYNIIDLEDAFTSGDLSYQDVRDLLSPLSAFSTDRRDGSTEAEHISHLRALAIGGAVFACIQAFKAKYGDIMSGKFSDGLVDVSDKSDTFAAIKTIANQQLFTSARKTKLEVSGRATIHNVLNGITPVYAALQDKGWDKGKLGDYEKQVARALELDLRDVTDSYSALHSMADFTSGMTDRYAVKMSRMLSGI
ncbi:dGTP triphosphohydrolase [Halocynthiibacter namhaensis]|uniref:dGTP triphosphohydrolase n=1 Tax=Halocynthiibacter namhaensis TaxID=1290553 RepID=UPI00192E46E9|nr:dNTP triphosphohydrolase [Halocynthiibacter namhaensis]